ncbi:MAG: aconitase X [Anaerolineae bacterium]
MLHLTNEEQDMLAGGQGPAVKRAMEIVTTLGRIYEAEELVPVASVQVAGVSYRNLGDAGLEFLQDWAKAGARVRVQTTLNPSGMDHTQWQRQGFSAAYAGKQAQVLTAYQAMGIELTCTCTPYLVGNVPGYGQHLAWSESSAVAYANAVLGARTNREGGPSALAAAICGRTAKFGLQLSEHRLTTHRVQVRCPVQEIHEYAALGYLVGKQVGDGIPYFTGLKLPAIELDDSGTAKPTPGEGDVLKMLGAALASSGAVALYHIEGVTPEARLQPDLVRADAKTIVIDSLQNALNLLNKPVERIDLVVIGCPHASLSEIEQIARFLHGKKLKSDLWVTTARATRAQAALHGWVETIEEAGGLVTADACVVVAPMPELRYRTLATNSAKMASYAMPHAGLQVRFGSLQHCLEAAVTGRWSKS